MKKNNAIITKKNINNKKMKFNDINMQEWKQSQIKTDSLWLINSRDKSGKHENNYHGNFIPQIANELICRYTKNNETILDIFLGSGTTLFECERLNRKCIGTDINEQILKTIKYKMQNSQNNRFVYEICDNTDANKFNNFMQKALNYVNTKKVQFVFFHPPYFDIVKFTNKPYDLSQCNNLQDFMDKFLKSLNNALNFLEKDRYFAIIIGDIYKNSQVLPLGFDIMDLIRKNFKVKLKGIIVKDIQGNRGKLGAQGIWRYRALKSDYYIFKHEYIFVFKKEME